MLLAFLNHQARFPKLPFYVFLGGATYLAEVTMYNCMVGFLRDLGMGQKQAEQYCNNIDNLTELAQYISSILG
ncbi:hypothetical protein IQ238_13055 [Pleurocapsales cyanobacterium LEGE 06147]|nr:hypothetical protein [Pleurocapsales cyanobacterium LEGE 06147]